MKRKGIIAVAVASVLILVSVVIYQTQSAPTRQRIALHAALVNNLVILDSTQFVSTGTPTAVFQHQTIAGKLEESLETLEKMSKGPLSEEQAQDVKHLIATERKVLETYSKNLSILNKVLSYNPPDDIGRLQPGSELTSRAKAASSGIGAILRKDVGEILTIVEGEISLSRTAHSSLESAKACFDKLAARQTTARQCIKTYDVARQQLNNDLKNLWTTSELKQSQAKVIIIIEQLQT